MRVLGFANFLLAEFNLVLKSPVDIVGLGPEHLVFQFGDVLFLRLNIGVALFALFLVGRLGRAIGFSLRSCEISFFSMAAVCLGSAAILRVKSARRFGFLQADHQLQVGSIP